MAKPVLSRQVEVEIKLGEQREGAYSHSEVASAKLTIPLPATDALIGSVVQNIVTNLVAQVETFRGPIFDADQTAVIERSPEALPF